MSASADIDSINPIAKKTNEQADGTLSSSADFGRVDCALLEREIAHNRAPSALLTASHRMETTVIDNLKTTELLQLQIQFPPDVNPF